MKKPTQQDFDTAIMWLLSNNGNNGEAESCGAVAGWIEAYIARNAIRSAAREVGCSVKYFRKYMQGKA